MNDSMTTRREALGVIGALCSPALAQPGRVQSWPLATPSRTGIHDVAPAPDGGVWFSAQRSGHLGWFDPKSARVELVALGRGSSPHGVIQGPDRAAWLTDSGQNAIVRVGWPDRAVRVYPLPEGSPYANLNTAAFDGDGDLWFTGQSGIVGKLALKSGDGQRQRTRRKAAGLMASAPRRPARSGGARSPARTSRASTARAATRSSSSHRPRTRARAASGATAAAASGSANGTRASSRFTTPRPRRRPRPGGRGSCQATGPAATPSMSMSATSSGPATSAATRCGASIRRTKSSSASASRARPRASARSSAGQARSGCRRVAPSTSR